MLSGISRLRQPFRDEGASAGLKIGFVVPFFRYRIHLTLSVYCIFMRPFCKVLLVLEICEANGGSRSVATMQKRDNARRYAFRYRTIEHLELVEAAVIAWTFLM